MNELRVTVDTVRRSVDARLSAIVAERREQWSDLAPSRELLQTASDLLTGGKRMRAVLGAVALAYRADGESRLQLLSSPVAAHLGAALELYQASALVHDDVIDAALTRRGIPTAHHRHSQLHTERSWRGDPQAYGVSAAILLGDLLLSAAGMEMGAAARAAAVNDGARLASRDAFDAMTQEVALGQFLDVRSEVLPLPGPDQDPVSAGSAMLDDALAVVRRKAARYSVMHPLLIGALLAGARPNTPLYQGLATFGEEIGIAFQLRDDVLGVFGDPALTGKPAGDDLREGKRTALLAMTWRRSNEAGRDLLREVLARPKASAEAIARVVALIESCGAREAHEQEIVNHTRTGLDSLTHLGGEVSASTYRDLTAVAETLTTRNA